MTRALHRLLGLAALLLAAGVASLLAPTQARAAVSSCSIASSSITFSPYNPVTKAAVDIVGTVSVTCTGSGNDTVVVDLSGGNSGSCTTPRQMRQGSAPLNYQLYTNSARTSVWCTGGAALSVPISFGGGSPRTFSVSFYGRVIANQTPLASGAYSDSLTITVRKGGTIYGSNTLSVSGSVSATCSVTNATLPFGSYLASTARTASGAIALTCSTGATYSISLAAGANANAGSRRMANGGSFLAYELFSNSGLTLLWGNGTTFGQPVAGTGTGAAQNVSVHGRIAAGQFVPAGNYSDTVVVTVSY